MDRLWRYIKGLRPVSGFTASGNMLRLDGVNDKVGLANSAFYNFGPGDFTLVVQASHILDYQAALAPFIGKFYDDNRAQPGQAGYAIGIRYHRVQFGLKRKNASGQIERFYLTSPQVERGKVLTIVCGRDGGGDPRTAENYHLWVDGVRHQTIEFNMQAMLDNGIVDNELNFAFGCQEPNLRFMKGYMSTAAVYNRWLTDEERSNIFSLGAFPNDGTKGIWPFNQRQGKTVYDSSSVGTNGAMLNYTDEETGSFDPNSNRVWVPQDGVLYFNAAGQVKEFTAGVDLTVNKIGRWPNAINGTIEHIRSGAVIGTFNLGLYDTDLMTGLNINMVKWDKLRITSNTVSTESHVEIYY